MVNDTIQWSLILERPFGTEITHWGNKALVDVIVSSEQATAWVSHANRTTYADFTWQVESVSWEQDAEGFRGEICGLVTVAASHWPNGPLTLTLEGSVREDGVTGRYTTRQGETVIAEGPLRGSARTTRIPNPGEAIYQLYLDRAADGGKAVLAHLRSHAGAMVDGVAYAPQFNHGAHTVDVSGVRLEGSRLRGRLGITINADPYIPADGRAIASAYDLDVEIAGGSITGPYVGSFDAHVVRGRVSGVTIPVPARGRANRIWLKLEEGVAGGVPWFNRCYVYCSQVDGQVREGSFSNNKGGWIGRFDGAELHLEGETLTGVVTCTVSQGDVTPGTYEFHLSGRLIGEHLTGTYTSILAGTVVQQGILVGGVTPIGHDKERG